VGLIKRWIGIVEGVGCYGWLKSGVKTPHSGTLARFFECAFISFSLSI
jgi:hypothetical protein